MRVSRWRPRRGRYGFPGAPCIRWARYEHARGAAGATFGAAAGPLYVIYFSARQLERDAFRVTITAILQIQGCLRIAGYAQLGFFDYTTAILVAAGLPLMLLGAAIGHWLGATSISAGSTSASARCSFCAARLFFSSKNLQSVLTCWPGD
jgi:hypothetical protein